MDRLAITSQKPDIAQCVALASKYHVGIEIQVYGYQPSLLDGDWRSLLKQQKALLRGFEGEIAFHGAFYDMSGASVDPSVVALTRSRYIFSMQIAAELGACHVVFHANYLPWIRRPAYQPDWLERQATFFYEMVEEAKRLDVVIALENMWEPEPGIIARVVERVDSPYLGVCLDVGHVYLYSYSMSCAAWVERLQDHLIHYHINNHHGLYDEHLPLCAEGGIIDYDVIVPMIEGLPEAPFVSIEMEHLDDLEMSLRYLLEK
ncbi:MAG: sugar phosphate isomerase/epimerase [Anaerolineae bacterium]|nr:sugar phosphate isomerase/epimerase [Anaerolineae bacterium]